MKPEIVMIGNCPKCSREHVRKPPVDAAACPCTIPEADATLVPLQPAVALSNAEYAKFEKIAAEANVSVEALVNRLLVEGAREKLKAVQPLPSIVTTAVKRQKA